MPQVSIIMPVYNSGKFIEKTINSVIKQTYTDWELIIIDDGSVDNSLDIINRLKNEKFIIIKNKKNIGAALSRNEALKIAKGRYIAFLDSDDMWKKDKLKKQYEFMKEKDIAFSFSSYERVDEKGIVISTVVAPKEVDYNCILKNTPIQISTVMIDTKRIKRKLLKMPNIKTCEDIAMYLQILNGGVKAYGIQEYFVVYQVRKKSLSSNKFANTIRRWKIYKQYDISFKDRCINILKHIKNALVRIMPNEKIKRIIEVLKIFNYNYIFDFLLFPIIWLISICTKPRCKNIWLIQENPNEACDNGYEFFKYIRNERKDINAYYVIKQNAKDYEKVKKLGNTINYRSLKHWIYYLNACKVIITQKYANPSLALFYILHVKNIIKVPRVFLQHGVIINDCKAFYYNRTKFRLFICGAKKEYEYIKENYGYPASNVVYTGLARFDSLITTNNKRNNFILIAPTWRRWINNQKEFDAFIKNYYELINNKELIEFIEKRNINIKLVLHKDLKRFKVNKNVLSSNISINQNVEVNIQDLLNKADLLITDYSSIFMDIAYRKRPIIYYQFDKEKFREEHLSKGYFDYEVDGFGDIINNPKLVIEKIKYYIENNLQIEKKYFKRMNEFFERKDKNNCKRILEEIEKI